MEQEYTISTGTKIFYGALAVGLFGFSIFLFSMPKNVNVSPAVYILPLLLMAGSVLIIVNIIKRKVIIYDDRIVCINLLATKELAFTDIKGCRIGQKVIWIEPVSDNYPKITISNYIDLGNSEDLVTYLKTNFKDQDEADLEQEHDRLLHDTSIGTTEADREEKLKKAKQISIAYNITGVVFGFGLIFFETQWSVVLLLIYPLIGIGIILLSNGLIKFLSNRKRSVYGFIVIGFIMPLFILFFKSMDDHNVYRYDNVWLPFAVVSLVVFGVLVATGINKSVGSVTGQIIAMLVVALFYGFGSVLQVNFAFDKSTAKVYHATVLDHRISHGKHTSYYLTLSQWGPMDKEKEVDVHRWLYNDAAIGDTVEVDFKEGLLNIPWYTVTK